MADLALQRCFNHALREAVARCPECGQFFCRECVTEHDERVVCTACLKRHARVPLLRRRGLSGTIRTAQLVAGIFIAWFFFYFVGDLLMRLPSSFHEGSIWQVHWMDEP